MIVASQQLKFLHLSTVFCFISFKGFFMFILCLLAAWTYFIDNCLASIILTYMWCTCHCVYLLSNCQKKMKLFVYYFNVFAVTAIVFIIYNICYFITTQAILISILLWSHSQTFMKFKSTWKIKMLVKIDWKTRF